MKSATLRMRNWRKHNPERQRENDRRWRRKNLSKARAKNRAWYKKNREYKLQQNRLWYEKNYKKKEVKTRIRLRKHRMTRQEHDLRLKEQQNRCAICRKLFLKTPHIDHCHKTNRNRGLLCDNCNPGLGHFFDSIKILGNAIKYLEKWNEHGKNRYA